MDSEKHVELLRIPEEERVYDREEVLGRDAKSVFPTESKAEVLNAAKEMLGSTNRFITESELNAIRAERGEKANEGLEAPMKPLVEVLREAKEAKEEAFQAVWRSMKTGKNRPPDEDELEFVERLLDQERHLDEGCFSRSHSCKNRPLDEDELDFVERLLDQERQKDLSVREEEKAALDAFQQAVKEAAERRQAQDESAAPSAAPAQPKPKQAPPPKRKPAVPLIRVKAAKKQNMQQAGSAAAAADSRVIEERPAEEQHNGKAQRDGKGEQEAPEDGLGGLIGAYGSDSEEH